MTHEKQGSTLLICAALFCITSGLQLAKDNHPHANQRAPQHPGGTVWTRVTKFVQISLDRINVVKQNRSTIKKSYIASNSSDRYNFSRTIKHSVIQNISHLPKRSPILLIIVSILFIVLSGLLSIFTLYVLPDITFVQWLLAFAFILIGLVMLFFISFPFSPLNKGYQREKDNQIVYQKAIKKFQGQESHFRENPTIAFTCLCEERFPVVNISSTFNQLGYSSEEFSKHNLPFADIIHPEDIDRFYQELKEWFAAGLDDFKQEFRVITGWGEERWVDAFIWKNRNPSENLTHIQGVLVDVTRHKASNPFLLQANQFVDRIFSMDHVLQAYLDHEFNFLRVNDAFSNKMGESLDFYPGKNFFELFPNDENLEVFRKVISENETAIINYKAALHANHDNTPNCIWDWVVQPLKNHPHEKSGILISLIDGSKQHHAHLNLEMERSSLDHMLDSLVDGAYIVNRNFDIEYTNPVINAEFGPIKDQKCFNYFYNRSTNCSPCSFELLEQGKPVNRVKAKSKSGKSFYVFSILLNNPDKSMKKLSILHDVTELKEKEEMILQSNLELQKATEESQKQRKFAEALIEASIIVNSSLNLDDVLTRILEQVQIAIPFQRAYITLSEEGMVLSAKVHLFSGINDPIPEINDSSSLRKSQLHQTIMESWSPILIQNTLVTPDWNQLDHWGWVRSFLSVPLISKGQVIGSIILLSQTTGFFTQEISERLAAFASHATIAIQNAWLFDQVRVGSEHLKNLSQHQTNTLENERQYIARELHDEVGQAITSLLLDLHLLEKQVEHPETVLERVKIMENTLLSVSNDLHRVAMSLRPASLDHLGLVAAIRQHVNSILQRHTVKIKIIDNSMKKRFPKNVETMVFRTVQEALTNVIRHAHASHVEISLSIIDNKLIVTVEDDGIGFDPRVNQNPSHLGLLGMQERVQMVNGKLTVESASNKGTKVIVEVDDDNPGTYR